MSLIHEIGHCLSITVNGGSINGVVWRYGFLSETLRSGSNHPVVDIWSGPLFGAVIPLLIWFIFRNFGFGQYLQWFASICLIGNGLYLGFGWLESGTDSYDLILNDVGLMPIMGLGSILFILGLFLLMWSKPHPNQSLHGSGPQ
jgi:hypothetical protein